MAAHRARYLASALIVAIVLSFAADGLTAGRGGGLAAAADLRNWPAVVLAAATLPASSLSFVALSPCRVADTRGNGFVGQYGTPAIAGGAVRTFTIAGQCGIPMSAVAVSFNFTVTDLSTNGDLRVFPAGAAVPLVSTQNWTASTGAIANAAATPLGTGGAVSVQVDGPGAIDLIIDVNGYYVFSFNSTLSSGATLTGIYGAAGATGIISATIEFQPSLAFTPTAHYVTAVDATCPGPGQAAAGHLCVYPRWENAVSFNIFTDPTSAGAGIVSAKGAVLLINSTSTSSNTRGVWAVTAP